MASTLVNSPAMCKFILTEVSRKIKREMKDLSSNKHDSLLSDTVEAVKHFHWETVALELEDKMPTLLILLKQLLPRPMEQKPLLCLLASQLLKSRHQRMGLVQRAVSVMLYGNGSSKEVYMNLQPLNVCMSYVGTLNIVEKISEYHNVEVQFWGDELKERIPKPAVTRNTEPCSHQASFLSFDAALSSDDESQYEAPAFSPLSEIASSFIESEVEELLSEDDEQYLEDTEIDEAAMEPTSEPASSQRDDSWWCGYKFVGDNVDKNVKPSLQRQEIKGQSLHHFHAYALKDRVNLASLSDSPPARCDPDPNVLLPSTADVACIREEMCILLSRIIVQHMDDFKGQAKQVTWHIPSKYAKEMSMKTEVIPLGIQLHNENKLDEMSKILEHFMTLVPTLPAEGKLVLGNGSTIDFDNTRFFKILLGGDQLTAARVRGTQALRDTEDKAVDRLEGVVAVVEDWHTRMALMKTIWQRLYSANSTKEKATMYQLRNLINRTSIPSDPGDNMNAAEDFLLLLLHAHGVAAAKVIQSVNPLSSVSELSRAVVASFTRLPQVSSTQKPEACEDGIHMYAVELLTLGLLWHGFHDAIREGDGERIIRYWKFFLIIFKSSNHPNYAKEAVHFLLQYEYLFSERQKAQLLWSRCVNTKGYRGANIPCDLHMEHLNRRLKTVLRGLGANISPKAVVKAGKALQQCSMYVRRLHGKLPSTYLPIITHFLALGRTSQWYQRHLRR